MPDVSIIIPVYNAREHITGCIDSVIAQTIDNIEVIFVDDHGQDDSIAVAKARLQEYCGRKTFRLTSTQTNSGPGAARNRGLAAAEGRYVAFLDSDDTIDPEFCEKLVEAASRADADIACCAISFDKEGGKPQVRHNPAVVDGPFEGSVKKSYLRSYTSYFTTYIYSREMIARYGIQFPPTHSAEDSCFLGCCLLAAKRIAAVDIPMYHYFINGTSVSQKKDPSRWKNRISSFTKLKEFAKANGLYGPYKAEIDLLSLKKGHMLAARDFLTNNILR